MSPWLIKALIAQYAVIVITSVIERRYHWALYFFGATLISLSVLWMGRIEGR